MPSISIQQIGYKTLSFHLVGEMHAGVVSMVTERILALPAILIQGRRVSKQTAIRFVLTQLRARRTAIISWV